MSFPKPSYSRNEVNKAGRMLVAPNAAPDDWVWAYDVLTNWRASHGYPINTFQATWRSKLKRIDDTALIAQRLKRTPSILSKLRRIRSMSLARMQDIGGLRAVTGSMAKLRLLRTDYKRSHFTHELIREDDYVAKPKASGYRSVHLVYRYRLDSAPDYSGLLVELQFRTRLQHAWATAVETMGTFLNHSLKSSEGPAVWLKFFSLCSSAFAYVEHTTRVPGFVSLSRNQTFMKTATESHRLSVPETLQAYSSAVNAIPGGIQRAAYYLVILDVEAKSVSVESFSREQLESANRRYSEVEKNLGTDGARQAVLVSAGSVEALRRAYPNYFLDTDEFLYHLSRLKLAATEAESEQMHRFRRSR